MSLQRRHQSLLR